MSRVLPAVIAAIAVCGVIALPPRAFATHTRGGAVMPCAAKVHDDVLPVWMRAGFSGLKPRVPYVLGKHGLIGGVLFVDPLNSPPAKTENNKILWVPRRSPKSRAALWIRMQQMDGTQLIGAPVRRIIAGGPGPSYVDAPAPGCWRLTLSWAGRKDTLDLDYVPPTN